MTSSRSLTLHAPKPNLGSRTLHGFSRERKILGLRATAITGEGLLDRIDVAILRRQRITIASLNFHGIYMYFTDLAFRALHQDNKTLVRIDGMSVIILARLLRASLHREHRIAWIDLLPHLVDRAANASWRVFYLGGEPEILEAGLSKLRAACPALEVDGCHGYFSTSAGSLDNEQTLARIEAFRPDILLVGMGMGRQERWILENRARLDIPVVAVCGACIEYFAGRVSTAPRWLGQIGLEWTYRLLSDPRRFAWRYLVEPWLAMTLLLAARIGLHPANCASCPSFTSDRIEAVRELAKRVKRVRRPQLATVVPSPVLRIQWAPKGEKNVRGE